MIPLPIDALLPAVVASLRQTPRLVLQAPAGSGKTTRLPRALLDAALPATGEIAVLEPRRLAARYAARRVAEELGESVGQTVGYQVRFEDISSAATRVRFLTAGVLNNYVLRHPHFEGINALLVDEFHERNVQADTALALALRAQQRERPDLLIVLMSATLDGERVANTLQAPLLRAEGRSFPVEIHHAPKVDDRPLPSQIASAVREAIHHEPAGHVLVFLPGVGEIQRCRAACARLADEASLRLLPLHGDASPEEQDRAFAPSEMRKIILATNVAESSVTIDGISVVVDSGLARMAVHSPWSGYGSLRTSTISQASADQRAGRAGRTRPGQCFRLYTEADFRRRPAHDVPEVQRLDLTETVLLLLAQGIVPTELPWFDMPPAAALEAAQRLLQRLGAVHAETGALTEEGRRMARLPLSPRMAKFFLEAEQRGLGEAGAQIAALIEERDLRLARRGGIALGAQRGGEKSSSDVLARLDDLRRSRGLTPAQLVARGLDPGVRATVERSAAQLRRGRSRSAGPSDDEETALLRCLLSAYPDRVARRRQPGRRELIVVGGTTATLAEESVVQDARFVVVIDAHAGTDKRPGGSVLVRLASQIEPDWLLDQFPKDVRDERLVSWNASTERVDVTERLVYDGLVLDESKEASGAGSETTAVLLEAARKRGLHALFDPPDALERWLSRVRFLSRFVETFPSFDEATLWKHMEALCEHRRSFAELRQANLLAELEGRLTGGERALLAREAPERLVLPGGRRAQVNYPENETPFVASRIQDFFGLRELPPLANGSVRPLVHLLAPNQRAVQVTADLANFWASMYPSVRRELGRRYPRHPWPEDPAVALPPDLRRRREPS